MTSTLLTLANFFLAFWIIGSIIFGAILIRSLLLEYERLQLEGAIIRAISKGNYRNSKGALK